MRDFVCFAMFSAMLSIAAASSQLNGSSPKSKFEERMASIFEQGYNQIMLSNPSPTCKKIALTNLAAAQEANNQMKCDTFGEKAFGVGQVFDQAVDSFTDLIKDLNTIVNGIPMCGVDHYWFNFIYSVPCVLGQFSDIWHAAKDFFYYSDFYMNTIHKVQDFMNCLSREKHAADSVKTALNYATMCK
ncbi:Hypothetical protein NTJ_01470 [Nesidiocoris tenuis]|uniref:Protein TsetseEP domain-containing protein n=1 Tax=Nesidiocoris tenuis TaxID=355587 RepID=A0ABN7A8N8_9HEMI|nr:Hypothetical protein NTJ_01470 [Nesidiocoris tenuis]